MAKKITDRQARWMVKMGLTESMTVHKPSMDNSELRGWINYYRKKYVIYYDEI